MAIDLDKLIDYNDNIYTFTCAAIKRSQYVAELRKWCQDGHYPTENQKIFSNEEKVVSVTFEEILSESITYHIGE